MRTLIITTMNTAEVCDVNSAYPEINRALGVKFVQAIYTPGLTWYMDEEGKMNGWEPNLVAELLYRSFGGQLYEGDFLAGPVAVVGSDGGEVDIDVPDHVIQNLRDMGVLVGGNL